jgi:hypothetical protein
MLQSRLHGVVSPEKRYREFDLLQIWQEGPDVPECKPKCLERNQRQNWFTGFPRANVLFDESL